MRTFCVTHFSDGNQMCDPQTKPAVGKQQMLPTLWDKHKVSVQSRTEQPLIVAFEQFLWLDLIAHFLRRRRVLDYKAHQSLVRTEQMPQITGGFGNHNYIPVSGTIELYHLWKNRNMPWVAESLIEY